MGNINTDVGSLRDLITEEVGCKSGLLLTDRQALALLKRIDHPDSDIFEQERDRHIRIRPEDIEEVIVHLRHKVGELPDTAHPIGKRAKWTQSLISKGIDPTPIYDAFKSVVESEKYTVLGQEAATEMAMLSGMSELLVAEFLLLIAEQMDRSVSWFQARIVDLKWAVPLASVFESETIPNDPEAYLDQRYIDYFSQNGEDLARLHWRNFERLTAEFFRHKGFDVSLGQGSKDGGVDVRVWPSGVEKNGPPLLLIQCKRYSANKVVGIETVKAFWCDVAHEGAQNGLIATTSRVSPGGIKESRARKWPLGFSQQRQVSHWVRTMWRHAPSR